MAIRTFGALLSVDGTPIGGRTTVSRSGGSVNNIETTDHDSVDGRKTFIGGLIDEGSLNLEYNFAIADAGQVKIRSMTGMTKEFVFELSDGTTITCDAIIGVESEPAPIDDVVKSSVDIKITGSVVIAAGA